MQRLTVGAALAAAILLCSPALAAPPPLSAFARMPAIEDADISPNGARVATLATTAAGQRLVNIAHLDSGKLATLPMGDIKTRTVRFAGDDYVLVHTSLLVDNVDPHRIYQFQRHVVVDADGKVLTRLLNGVDLGQFATALPVLRVLHETPSSAIVQGWDLSSAALANNKDSRLNTRAQYFVPVLWRVDVKSGRGRIIERGAADTEGWAVDASGEPRVRMDANYTTSTFTLLARSKNGSWKRLTEARNLVDLGDIYVGFSDPEDAVYLVERQADGSANLVRQKLGDGTKEPVRLAKPAAEVGVLWDEYAVTPAAFVTEAEKRDYDWRDPLLGKAHARVARTFKDQQVTIYDWSRDKTKVVVRVESPDIPPVWYLLDTAAGSLSPIGESYPELQGAALGKTRWITYKARDGLEISAYLTLPPGSPVKPPVVVLPHGGPATRDNYEFDFLTQFLASRGYAVLRPQFRGSAGFGKAFMEAGHREWAGKMQTDLIDGINHAAAQGLVDGGRACIVGASYGGYAAQASAAFHSSAYRCAVSINGVSDLPGMIGEYRPSYESQNSGLAYWRQVLGRESGTQAAALASASPVNAAARVGAPLLLIHGKQDTVVPYEQSLRMQKAMAAAGKPVDLITLPGDDHHFSSAASRAQILQSLENFLGKHLPVS